MVGTVKFISFFCELIITYFQVGIGLIRIWEWQTMQYGFSAI